MTCSGFVERIVRKCQRTGSLEPKVSGVASESGPAERSKPLNQQPLNMA
jgi:hypothetical protein